MRQGRLYFVSIGDHFMTAIVCFYRYLHSETHVDCLGVSHTPVTLRFMLETCKSVNEECKSPKASQEKLVWPSMLILDTPMSDTEEDTGKLPEGNNTSSDITRNHARLKNKSYQRALLLQMTEYRCILLALVNGMFVYTERPVWFGVFCKTNEQLFWITRFIHLPVKNRKWIFYMEAKYCPMTVTPAIFPALITGLKCYLSAGITGMTLMK